MENRDLDKALDIVSHLLMGEEIASKGNYAGLYEEYSHNSEVYNILMQILKKLDLRLYEYNNTLFTSAGSNNKVFGFTNEELKKMMGLKVNKELFMTYLITYCMLTEFYKDSSSSTYLEYLKIEDVIKSVDGVLIGIINTEQEFNMERAEVNSFKELALLWDDLPIVSIEDKNGIRAAKNSKSGFVKITFNFLVNQGLFIQAEETYYPTDRFKAIAENYFEENKGNLYEILNTSKGEKKCHGLIE